jgi:hypothetical protein
MRVSILLSLPVALFTAGCAGFAVQGQKTPYGAGPAGTTMPTVQRPAAPTAAARAGAKGAESRIVCRTSGVESGWIVVDYVNDTKACGGSVVASKSRPAALIVNYRLENVGEELDVCADQRTPEGWVVREWLANDGRCQPDSPTDDATVKRIRRIS